MEEESEIAAGFGKVIEGGESADLSIESENHGNTLIADNRCDPYKIVSVEDCPELFPFLAEQFHQLKIQFPSISHGSLFYDVSNYCRTLAERLLVMVDWTTLRVVAGITFMFIPQTSSIYVGYMITDSQFRGNGFMKRLFQEMKDYAKRLHPESYYSGFSAIVAETLVHPLPEYGDYFSTWENVRTTHATLNRIGFYQCAFNYVMFGEVEEDGLLTKGSTDYIMVIHKDSTKISKCNHPNFFLEIDSWYLESVMYNFVRMGLKAWYPPNLGEEFLATLSSVPAKKCFIRQQLPFYRTDHLYPEHPKLARNSNIDTTYFHDNKGSPTSDFVLNSSSTSGTTSLDELKAQLHEVLIESKKCAENLLRNNKNNYKTQNTPKLGQTYKSVVHRGGKAVKQRQGEA